ncbi:CCCH zinc finger DNA binding protein [Histoplasma capsulatum G186AR]|uniref:CCCH zinc finger DNA binding protein n=1 Tax=Ajellomyces capsulatus TaxID=5037 RepID=A0A8H8CS96_AJECA|nr:CCCH zinc finger DNA binding protein [Histoplasma capsulatum]QSS71358.1 CCCH zinc finger DNA binding protein [Histoplasma capsulatum G186AR]
MSETGVGMASPDHEHFMKLREANEAFYGFVEGLLQKIKDLELDIDEKKVRLEKQEDMANMYHQRSREAKTELTKLQQNMERNAFVSVLVDGDSMNFLDEFVENGELGGQDAARRLIQHVSEYVQNELADLRPDLPVVVRVYANLKGLRRTYQEAHILDDENEFELFVRGFNMGHPLCDFVDAGAGKECSDEKIRETFKLHAGNVHCKHIVFAGSTDNGYARLLGPYSSTTDFCKRVTMLEGPPFEKELAQLKDKYRTTSFPTVFRDTKLPPIRRVSFSATPIYEPNPTKSPPSYASAASFSSSPPAYNGSRPSTPAPVEKTPGSPSGANGPAWFNGNGTVCGVAVLKNKHGQRVDSPIKPSSSIVQSLKSRKLCNPYHLLGTCHFLACKHEHGERLNDKMMEALRYVARLAPCPSGLECEDENCYSGHRCPNNPCHRPNCHFPKEMHGVDTKICKTWSVQ